MPAISASAAASPRRLETDTPLSVSEETWDAMTGINLRAGFFLAREVGRHMVERGAKGRILLVTSQHRDMARNLPHYSASKAGMTMVMKELARVLAPNGIRVNALAPDITITEGIRAIAPEGSEERFGLTVPMGRAGHVDEMAGVAVFLASDLASYVTGQTIHVDGGTHAASGWYHDPETGAYALGPT